MILHTSDINCLLDDSNYTAIGFFTTRRAIAETPDDAFEVAMAQFDNDPKMIDLIQTGYDAGLNPKTEIEEIYKVPWYKTIFPWTVPGLAFYKEKEKAETPKNN
jgi:hypothetical protein